MLKMVGEYPVIGKIVPEQKRKLDIAEKALKEAMRERVQVV